MDKHSLQLLSARGVSVEEIGRRFGRDASTVAYWMRKHGLDAPNREKYAAKGAIRFEQLTELVDRGMSIAEIADEVERSKGTVRHWLQKYGLRTTANRRATEASRARENGLLVIRRVCQVHGETEFVMEGRSYYRCKCCRQERVARHRRGLKATLVAEAGGACVLCGYDRYLGALHFHHLVPEEKRLEINCAGATLSLAALRTEAAKCVVLCSNCHAEVESGLSEIALK